MGYEDELIKRIENGIRTIRNGSKTPMEAKLGASFKTLRTLNIGLYNDLLEEYKKVTKDLKK